MIPREDLIYKVYDRDGRLILSAPISCRYKKETEKSLLAHGYTIKINGKRLTKKEANT